MLRLGFLVSPAGTGTFSNPWHGKMAMNAPAPRPVTCHEILSKGTTIMPTIANRKSGASLANVNAFMVHAAGLMPM
jgi:hypothetical protein